MTRTIAALLVIAGVASAAPAVAQTKYFARERIAGMPISASTPAQTPSYTYTPVYSTTYSACSGGTQSASISGCTRSDGQAVAVSFCSASPQTTSKTCTSSSSSCGEFTQSRQWSGGGALEYLGSTQTYADALSLCVNGGKTRVAGVCQWNTGSTLGNVQANGVYYRTGSGSQTGPTQMYLSVCS